MESLQKKTGIVQFIAPDGNCTGPGFDIPFLTDVSQLTKLLNNILGHEEPVSYSFYIKDQEITDTIAHILSKDSSISQEKTLKVDYHPQSEYVVRPVSRCQGSLLGHQKPVLAVAFSPDGSSFASCSGDTTMRLWDLSTQTPFKTCEGHRNWVLCLAWSPDAKRIATGDLDGNIIVWNPQSGQPLCKPLKLHTRWITCICWEPLHLNDKAERLASGSKDCSIRIWNARTGTCERTLSQHTKGITCVKWGGEALLYSASQDTTIKVWDVSSGALVYSLDGHGHWVNTMALSTEYALRIGAFSFDDLSSGKHLESISMQQRALENYRKLSLGRPERLVSGSDDFTLFLWEPKSGKKPLTRMVGHQQLVNMVCFSPNQQFIASASFDKSIRIWNGMTGAFIAVLRGHVSCVYQICWSPDSRLLLSASKDSTLKVWNISNRQLKRNLPGHADEVFTVDWSPDGTRAASGSKDCTVKIWHH
eukprot:jgi/Galph1/839/GphlegSOOS_G5535.1